MGPDEPEAQKLGAEKATVSESPVDTSHTRTVSTVWPHGDFIVEDAPTVTRNGVELNSADFDKVNELAKASGVRLIVEGGN